MNEMASALPAFLLGLTFCVVALYVFCVAGSRALWRAIDERVEFRVKVLLASKDARAVPQIADYDSGVTRERFLADNGSFQRVVHDRPSSGASQAPKLRSAASVKAAPAKLPLDVWADGFSPLPATIEVPRHIEEGKEGDDPAPAGRKWTQPRILKAKPIKPPKGQRRKPRAGKKGATKPKTQAKKKGAPRPSSLVLAPQAKNTSKINGAISASETVTA